jgi:hypothetical protein
MFGEERDMPGFNVRVRYVLTGLLVLLALATHVFPSLSEGRIHIAGIDPSSASAGDAVYLYGGGAAPNASVVAMLTTNASEFFTVQNETVPLIVVGPANLTLGSTLANESGEWEIHFVTPNVLPGSYGIYAFDSTGLTSGAVSFSVILNATSLVVVPVYPYNATSHVLQFFISSTAVPSSGAVGTLVRLSGLHASGEEIDVYFDNLRVVNVTGQQGYWSVLLQVPTTSLGNHTIRAIDVGGGWMSATQFYVTSTVTSFSKASLSLFVFGLLGLGAISGTTLFILLLMLRSKRRQCR